MVKVDTHEIAWAAGLFDGEGMATNHKRDSQIQLRVGQTDPQVLYRFQAAVLGVGKVYGPYPGRGENRKPTWVWAATSFEYAQATIAVLFKFLSPIKQAQCKRTLVSYRPHPRTNKRAPGAELGINQPRRVYWKRLEV